MRCYGPIGRHTQRNRALCCGAIVFAVALFCLRHAPVVAGSTWELGPFTRPAGAQPILTPNPQSLFDDPLRHAPVHWQALHTFNPAAVVRQGAVYVLYRAEDDTGRMRIGGHTSRLGLASSPDGVHFTSQPEPVFFAAKDAQTSREWPGGVEDPRIVESEDGTYILAYTQYNGRTYDIGIATSKDLIHWTKFGPAFAGAHSGRFDHLRYKSGGILTTLRDGHLVAAKLQGKYWMYWGEGAIHLATSTDLIHWSPVVDGRQQPIAVLGKRPGHFDSGFPETGPPPLLTDRGIVLIYNGKNADQGGDPGLPPGTYAAGQALFSASDPAKLLSRADQPSLQPEMAFEKTGQYAAGTTFAEGLVLFHGRWMLYYGCADSFVAVVSAPAHPDASDRAAR